MTELILIFICGCVVGRLFWRTNDSDRRRQCQETGDATLGRLLATQE